MDSVQGTAINDVHIDVALIPAHARNDLAVATLEFVRSVLKQPGGRELVEAKTAARKSQQ